jgi:hypothetical protein
MVPVLSDAPSQAVVFFHYARQLAFPMLGDPSLLVKRISQPVILLLQYLAMSVQFVDEDGVGRINIRVLEALGWRHHSRSSLFLGLLKHINLPLGHGKFHGHSIS